MILEYKINFEHYFDWKNIAILVKERFLNKRQISEYLHILMQENNLNLRSDTEGLYHIYLQIIKNTKK